MYVCDVGLNINTNEFYLIVQVLTMRCHVKLGVGNLFYRSFVSHSPCHTDVAFLLKQHGEQECSL